MTCPTPTKRSFDTLEAAEDRMSAIIAWHDSIGSDAKVPTRAYRCRCGDFHLTSQPLNGGRKPAPAREVNVNGVRVGMPSPATIAAARAARRAALNV
jgi:hypothetical protein